MIALRVPCRALDDEHSAAARVLDHLLSYHWFTLKLAAHTHRSVSARRFTDMLENFPRRQFDTWGISQAFSPRRVPDTGRPPWSHMDDNLSDPKASTFGTRKQELDTSAQRDDLGATVYCNDVLAEVHNQDPMGCGHDLRLSVTLGPRQTLSYTEHQTGTGRGRRAHLGPSDLQDG